MTEFRLHSPYPPRGDQPAAISSLVQGLGEGVRRQTLLGVTGSGKTFSMAGVIAQVNRPTLVISHNKTLAAQLCSEFREFFPDNAVEYFVSYYDYYQPEAYIASSDTYIEKDSSINDEIDRLRHAATQAVLERRDVIVVASVSCIYGLGSPEDYMQTILVFRQKDAIDRDGMLRRLVDMQFSRVNTPPTRGQFRLRGEALELAPVDREILARVDFSEDVVESISLIDPITGEVQKAPDRLVVYPAKHFITPQPKLESALAGIEAELAQRLEYFQLQGKLLEAQRLEQRTRYDLEMLREIGYCNGVENYSRHLSGRAPGEPPATLLDYFPRDFLLFADESHVTLPQIQGMQRGDRSRKDSLVEHGFRLPSAYDNRPLSFEEFDRHLNQVVYVSATPGPYELKESSRVVEQIIRPTGLVDPEVVVRPVKGQVDDLLVEVKERAQRQERVLVTTLTKKMAEDLTEYMSELGYKVRYLHSDIDTLERIQILRDLRLGEFDCLVGINLLREGLDLPEVSLVAILDADQEGFLRSDTSLIQTIGRAARHVSGRVILYADRMTDSMRRALDETRRRREIQVAYNLEHGITPESIRKAVRDILASTGLSKPETPGRVKDKERLSRQALAELAETLERAMREAARELEFETAAALRDELWEVRKELGTRNRADLLVAGEPVQNSVPARKGFRKPGEKT